MTFIPMRKEFREQKLRLEKLFHQQGFVSCEDVEVAMSSHNSNAQGLINEMAAEVGAQSEGVQSAGGVAAIPKALASFLSMALGIWGPKLIEWLKAWLDSQAEG